MKKYSLIFLVFLCNNALAKIPNSQDLNSTCLIMEDQGLSGRSITNNTLWRNYYENDYGCNSTYKKLKASAPYILENNIAFYIVGSKHQINKIYLVLNVNDKAEQVSAINELKKSSSILYKRIIGKELPKDLVTAIQNSQPLKKAIGDYKVEVKRIDWPTNKGYELHFIIN